MRAFKHSGSRGLTIWEVVIVVALLGLILALFLPHPCGSRVKASRINCLSNLKQVGLATRIWAGDHGDSLPVEVSTNEGGLSELFNQVVVSDIFRVMSNELSVPKVVLCPADIRDEAESFESFNDANVSYFFSLDAKDTHPNMILAGDRNLSTNATGKYPKLLSGLERIDASRPGLGWTKALHEHEGNVALADGSAMQLDFERLGNQIQLTDSGLTNRVLFPNQVGD